MDKSKSKNKNKYIKTSITFNEYYRNIIDKYISSGMFNTSSGVVRAGLRELMRNQKTDIENTDIKIINTEINNEIESKKVESKAIKEKEIKEVKHKITITYFINNNTLSYKLKSVLKKLQMHLGLIYIEEVKEEYILLASHKKIWKEYKTLINEMEDMTTEF